MTSTKTFLGYGPSWVCLHFDFYAWGASRVVCVIGDLQTCLRIIQSKCIFNIKYIMQVWLDYVCTCKLHNILVFVEVIVSQI